MSEAERPRTPQATFDRIAPYYDVLNSTLSAGMDRRWRRRAVAGLALPPHPTVLDVATGSGALLRALIERLDSSAIIVGCDLNRNMLQVARRQLATWPGRAALVRADATNLPFASEGFDAVTIGFAIDDMPDRQACAREMRRVLKPGGVMALLELSQPDAPILRTAYRQYLTLFGALGRTRADGYGHLRQEILTYRGARAIEELLAGAGFHGYWREDLTGGIARLHTARR